MTTAAPESPAAPARPRVAPAEWFAMAATSAAMVSATALGWWPVSWAETVGFVTGGVCVWLAVRQHPATWPVGLANNVVFLMLFWDSRLYADASLQVVYFALGVYGWWNWLRGGTGGSALRVARASRAEWYVLAAFVPLATLGLRVLLVAVNGAAPWGDAVTTALSLAAQYLMCRKRVENWYLWIAADVIYVPLYLDRDLPLTAALYAVFLLMCLVGLAQWRAAWRDRAAGGVA